MDRLTLKQVVNKLLDDEVSLQTKQRATSELTIKIVFREGGIREVRSTVEQKLMVGPIGH